MSIPDEILRIIRKDNTLRTAVAEYIYLIKSYNMSCTLYPEFYHKYHYHEVTSDNICTELITLCDKFLPDHEDNAGSPPKQRLLDLLCTVTVKFHGNHLPSDWKHQAGQLFYTYLVLLEEQDYESLYTDEQIAETLDYLDQQMFHLSADLLDEQQPDSNHIDQENVITPQEQESNSISDNDIQITDMPNYPDMLTQRCYDLDQQVCRLPRVSKEMVNVPQPEHVYIPQIQHNSVMYKHARSYRLGRHVTHISFYSSHLSRLLFVTTDDEFEQDIYDICVTIGSIYDKKRKEDPS